MRKLWISLAFSAAALEGRPAPLPVESSIANLRLLDRIRDAAH